MLIPYGTDAPIYHRPWTTGAIIVINIAMFVFFGLGDYHEHRWLILQFDQINPLQWVTAAFMHASWMHLVGNMIFLWCFGMVVEGKLGWWKFALLYLVLALADGAIGQIPMYFIGNGSGGALGASGVIFALIAVAIIWAPANEMHCLFVLTFYYIRSVDLPILGLGVFFLVWEALPLMIFGVHMSSEVLHLLGMAVGFPIAIFMLRRKLVDCEGWDLFSRINNGRPISMSSLNPLLLAGRLFRDTPERDNAEALYGNLNSEEREAVESVLANPNASGASADQPAADSGTPETQPGDMTLMLNSLRQSLQEDNAGASLAVFRKVQLQWGIGATPEEMIVRLAHLLADRNRHVDSLEPLRALVCRGSGRANQARLRIATIQLKLQRDPAAALATLSGISESISVAMEEKRRQITREAEACLSLSC